MGVLLTWDLDGQEDYPRIPPLVKQQHVLWYELK